MTTGLLRQSGVVILKAGISPWRERYQLGAAAPKESAPSPRAPKTLMNQHNIKRPKVNTEIGEQTVRRN